MVISLILAPFCGRPLFLLGGHADGRREHVLIIPPVLHFLYSGLFIFVFIYFLLHLLKVISLLFYHIFLLLFLHSKTLLIFTFLLNIEVLEV
mmetsp:Transcript_7867/g.7350  ORF Transcript_7867/g.7350 Transcript_7867/m.7350 type:complete len:92 (+) Transcript_7867:1999-2274(+)